MSFPAGLTLVAVHGRFDTLPGGGAFGSVEFAARQPLVGAADNSIVPPFTITTGLDASGEFTVALPATNDPGWTPVGWAYTVRVTAGGASFLGTLQLDYLAATVELSDLLQVDGAAVAGTTYIALSQRGLAGGVAALDVDGDVTDASGAKITGGGSGGGPSPSSTVVAETTYGASSSAGNATTYSRGNHTHGTPAAPASTDISDSTSTGRAVLVAASQTAARTAIGAETSGAAAAALVTAEAYTDSAVATHSADTTSVHGITDTSALVLTSDGRLTNARTPSAHASSHASAGSDPVTLAQSQVTGLTAALTARTPVLVLGPVDAIPGGTATGTVIVRTAS